LHRVTPVNYVKFKKVELSSDAALYGTNLVETYGLQNAGTDEILQFRIKILKRRSEGIF